MATRYTVFGENLWRVAVSAFNAVVETGLPAVNISYVNNDQPPGPEVWTALANTFEWCGPLSCLPSMALCRHTYVNASYQKEALHICHKQCSDVSMCRFLLGKRPYEEFVGSSLDAAEPPPAAESHSQPDSRSNGRRVSSESELVDQERSDADLEASVLDTLCDTVLTGVPCFTL